MPVGVDRKVGNRISTYWSDLRREGHREEGNTVVADEDRTTNGQRITTVELSALGVGS